MLKGKLTNSIQTVLKSIQELDQQVNVLIAVLIKVIDVLTLILQVSLRSISGFDKKCKKV